MISLGIVQLALAEAEPEADPQFYPLPSAGIANRFVYIFIYSIGVSQAYKNLKYSIPYFLDCRLSNEPSCPNIAPLPRSQCAGRTSVCWSPGVRDTDCPGHGLCCYDGCVNICGTPAPAPAPVPIPAPVPPPRVVPIHAPHPPVVHVVKET